jgi:hypothetical protein
MGQHGDGHQLLEQPAGVGTGEEAGQQQQQQPLEQVPQQQQQQQQQQRQVQQQQLLVTAEDVQAALSGFVAAAFWRAGQHKAQQQQTEGGLQGWEDVGEWTQPLRGHQPHRREPHFQATVNAARLTRHASASVHLTGGNWTMHIIVACYQQAHPL